jgi:hypothetical protein
MKKIIPFLIFVLLVSSRISSQTPIDISEGTLEFGETSMPSFTVKIPEANYEATVDKWKDLLESGTKSKVVTEDNRMTIFGAKMKKVSDNPVNVYSRIERQDSTVNMNVAIELEKDKYAGSKEFTAVREYLLDFAKDRYLAVIDDQLSKEKKDLRDLKKDAKSIDRNQARNEKSIKKYDDLISSEQQKLAEFNNQQTSISSDITRLESGGMGAPESDTGTSALKDLKKEQKKVSREIKKSEKKIKHAERKIDKSQNDITGSYNDQYEANNKVTEQESVVKRLEVKRDAIKNFK